MKRFLAIALLVTASAQANDLSDAWRNFGKHSRIASGVKAIMVGIGVAASTKAVIEHTPLAAYGLKAVIDSRGDWDNIKYFADHTIIAGSTFATGFTLFYYYFPEHTKHALGIRDGWFS